MHCAVDPAERIKLCPEKFQLTTENVVRCRTVNLAFFKGGFRSFIINSLAVEEFLGRALRYRTRYRTIVTISKSISFYVSCFNRQVRACLTGIVPKQMWQPQNQSVSMFQVHVLQLMNDRLNTGFTELEILSIFCDICEGMVFYYFLRHYKILLFKIIHNISRYFYLSRCCQTPPLSDPHPSPRPKGL